MFVVIYKQTPFSIELLTNWMNQLSELHQLTNVFIYILQNKIQKTTFKSSPSFKYIMILHFCDT